MDNLHMHLPPLGGLFHCADEAKQVLQLVAEPAAPQLLHE